MPLSLLCLLCILPQLIFAADAQIRIASLNIASRHDAEFLEAIRRDPDLRAADILLLQEVVDSPRDHVASKIGSALGLEAIFASAFQRNREYAEGLALLSRYPLLETENIPLPRTNLHIGTTPRIALVATLDTPLGRIRVINTHMDDRLNDASERHQLAPIWERAARFTGPFVIGGDFNTSNIWWVAHLFPIPGLQHQTTVLRKEMEKRGFTTPLGSGPATFHLPVLKLRLDWIYLRDLRAVGSGVTPIRFSDHNSVWVAVREP
jgi:endonuclease/exonuclease/phosphatase family metal-dependent hydrolase